jgi:hypothetical protein
VYGLLKPSRKRCGVRKEAPAERTGNTVGKFHDIVLDVEVNEGTLLTSNELAKLSEFNLPRALH